MSPVAEMPLLEPVTEPSSRETLVAALRQMDSLSKLSEKGLEWLAGHGIEVRVPPGHMIFRQGEPAQAMAILLDGEIQVQRRVGGMQHNVFVGRSQQITGLLPYSRMKEHGGDGIATQETWSLLYPKTLFTELLRDVPEFGGIAVAVLLDRVREVTRIEQQSEKLNALNQLAGNLAHELNNPASAAQRSAMHLRAELKEYGHQKFALGALCLDEAAIANVRAWEASLSPGETEGLAPLEAAERETPLLEWLQNHGVMEPWELSAALAESGVQPADLDRLAEFLDTNGVATYLLQYASARRMERMTGSVLNATERIFRIIDAIKDYAYLDQAPLQEINIPQALHNTLTLLQSRLTHVELVENYAPDIPPISIFVTEMNQVWMALLENALDAIDDHGRLELRAYADSQTITVEIINDGPGIPEDMRGRIFEPFYTTKGPGPHLGLGLDTVTRIVRKHRGAVTVQQVDRGTCFQVRLPIDQGRAY